MDVGLRQNFDTQSPAVGGPFPGQETDDPAWDAANVALPSPTGSEPEALADDREPKQGLSVPDPAGAGDHPALDALLRTRSVETDNQYAAPARSESTRSDAASAAQLSPMAPEYESPTNDRQPEQALSVTSPAAGSDHPDLRALSLTLAEKGQYTPPEPAGITGFSTSAVEQPLKTEPEHDTPVDDTGKDRSLPVPESPDAIELTPLPLSKNAGSCTSEVGQPSATEPEQEALANGLRVEQALSFIAFAAPEEIPPFTVPMDAGSAAGAPNSSAPEGQVGDGASINNADSESLQAQSSGTGPTLRTVANYVHVVDELIHKDDCPFLEALRNSGVIESVQGLTKSINELNFPGESQYYDKVKGQINRLARDLNRNVAVLHRDSSRGNAMKLAMASYVLGAAPPLGLDFSNSGVGMLKANDVTYYTNGLVSALADGNHPTADFKLIVGNAVDRSLQFFVSFSMYAAETWNKTVSRKSDVDKVFDMKFGIGAIIAQASIPLVATNFLDARDFLDRSKVSLDTRWSGTPRGSPELRAKMQEQLDKLKELENSFNQQVEPFEDEHSGRELTENMGAQIWSVQTSFDKLRTALTRETTEPVGMWTETKRLGSRVADTVLSAGPQRNPELGEKASVLLAASIVSGSYIFVLTKSSYAVNDAIAETVTALPRMLYGTLDSHSTAKEVMNIFTHSMGEVPYALPAMTVAYTQQLRYDTAFEQSTPRPEHRDFTSNPQSLAAAALAQTGAYAVGGPMAVKGIARGIYQFSEAIKSTPGFIKSAFSGDFLRTRNEAAVIQEVSDVQEAPTTQSE